MKQFLAATTSRLFRILLYLPLLCGSFLACRKTEAPRWHDNSASQYSSDVIDKWITMQLRLMRNSIGIPNVAFSRYYAYSGVAAFLSLAPGTSINSFDGKLNGLTHLPRMDKSKAIYWPACVNASLASMNRDIFTTASGIDKVAIDSLETALNNSFLSAKNPVVIASSNAFGKAVANAVFDWSETDGYKHAGDPYTPPVGPGLWVPTPPAFAAASTPYWGNNRPIIAGSIHNTQPGPAIGYSENPKSLFFQMVKQVYDASQNLTPDQTAMAVFWRDIPGVSSPGHWLSILQQVIQQTDSNLDKAAFAYAITGVCLSDACISCWQTKYDYNLVRPITYIRAVMGYTTWASLLPTPAHPEHSSAHAVLSAATAKAFTALFDNMGTFTDHTYDYMGFAPRTYNSFRAIGIEAGKSRLYGGIHYQPSIEDGLIQGRKVAKNILTELGLHSQQDE